MTVLDRFKPALQSTSLPLALLLVALSTVFVFSGDRGYFYRPMQHNGISSDHLRISLNLSPEHGFQRFDGWFGDDGAVRYWPYNRSPPGGYARPYNRFPPGGYASMKLATLPFGESPSAQLYAARILTLLFFAAIAVLAYLSLCRLVSNRWIALTAALLSFSSYYLLYYNDMTASEGMFDLFGVMLTFHGMVVFVQEGRFRQLLVKTCIALLLGWHVLALLLAFVIFGLVSDLLRARSAAASSTPSLPVYVTLKHLAAMLLRSRYVLLGIVALGFGLSVLTFNFTMEYIALDGETPLTELPSFESMLKRTSVDRGFVLLPWNYIPFLEGQFSKVARMFIPYSLLGSGALHESPTWLPKFWVPILGLVLAVAGLVGSMFVRPRILFATLASFGFFWALPMRNQADVLVFESIYYIGIPLVLFTIVLLLARRLANRGDGVIAAAAVASLILFVTSSFQMGSVGLSAESAQIMRTAERDLRTIRKFVVGEQVTLLGLGGYIFDWRWAEAAIPYYLNRSIIRTTDDGFTVMRLRVDTDALLTPQNQHLFLYDTAGLMTWYRATYRSVVATEPIARRSEFDVYLIDDTVYYVKEPCDGSSFAVRIFLHVFPEDIDDLPDDREQHGFDNIDSYFYDRGVLFDDKCLAIVDLPQYDIAGFRTGRLDGDAVAWGLAHVIQAPKLVSAYPSVVAGEPIARSEFALYIDGGKLYYVKEPCDSEDVQDGFFLHIVPADIEDLPDARREYGFDNLDFRFDVRGVMFNGKCVASVHLPQYDIARITTGQFDGVARIWEIEFAPEANE